MLKICVKCIYYQKIRNGYKHGFLANDGQVE